MDSQRETGWRALGLEFLFSCFPSRTLFLSIFYFPFFSTVGVPHTKYRPVCLAAYGDIPFFGALLIAVSRAGRSQSPIVFFGCVSSFSFCRPRASFAQLRVFTRRSNDGQGPVCPSGRRLSKDADSLCTLSPRLPAARFGGSFPPLFPVLELLPPSPFEFPFSFFFEICCLAG